jgi:hypothetical protein
MKTFSRGFLSLSSIFVSGVLSGATATAAPAIAAESSSKKSVPVAQTVSSEPFKGEASPQLMDFSAMLGLGLIDSSGAFSVIGSAARKIVDRGFVGDINNQVFAELELGPAFFKGNTAFIYSAHLRWDFERDSKLRLFAIGGLGGNATGADAGNRWTLAPRFGVGAHFQVSEEICLRVELSHELTIAGISLRI